MTPSTPNAPTVERYNAPRFCGNVGLQKRALVWPGKAFSADVTCRSHTVSMTAECFFFIDSPQARRLGIGPDAGGSAAGIWPRYLGERDKSHFRADKLRNGCVGSTDESR
jgi:hypothetical protein